MNAAKYTNWRGAPPRLSLKPIDCPNALDLEEFVEDLLQVVGIGDVHGKDALEMIFAGASGISIGTATFGNPTAAIKVKGELEQLLRSKGYRSLSDAIGAAHE